MTIELTSRQRDVLKELLESAHREKVHELNRTNALGYKQLLRDKITTIEELRARIAATELVR
jgi:hypothetical protein